MKRLKTLTLVATFFLTAGNLALAQTALSEEQKAKMQAGLEEYAETLNLSEDQKSQFKTISIKYANQMKSVKENGGSKYSMYKKVKSIRKARNAEMEDLLNEEQYEAYLIKQKEMEKKMREKRKANG